jgi:putative hydrolase of the HAD superfamily
VAAVLAELARRGLALGVASNFDRRLRTVAAGLPELTAVRHLVISSEVGWRKPAPEFFAEVVRAVGCDPGEVLLVGDDRPNDHDGAIAAGLRAVLLDPLGAADEGVERIASLAALVA